MWNFDTLAVNELTYNNPIHKSGTDVRKSKTLKVKEKTELPGVKKKKK